MRRGRCAELADRASTEAAELIPALAVARFRDSAARLREAEVSTTQAISYPVVGSTTMAVIVDVALMEATVHLLDLAAAVGGVTPSPRALVAARDLLVAVADPASLVEVLAGRVAPEVTLPVVR